METTKQPRLLVVDDDPGVIAAYRIVLERSRTHRMSVQSMFGLHHAEANLFGNARDDEIDWRITFLGQGLDAVRAVESALRKNDPFSAIFLDVRMPPGIDGYEAAVKIRQLDRDVHIVVVSGYADYYYEDFLEIAGPSDRLTFLQKPVWPDELRKMSKDLASEWRAKAGLHP